MNPLASLFNSLFNKKKSITESPSNKRRKVEEEEIKIEEIGLEEEKIKEEEKKEDEELPPSEQNMKLTSMLSFDTISDLKFWFPVFH